MIPFTRAGLPLYLDRLAPSIWTDKLLCLDSLDPLLGEVAPLPREAGPLYLDRLAPSNRSGWLPLPRQASPSICLGWPLCPARTGWPPLPGQAGPPLPGEAGPLYLEGLASFTWRGWPPLP